MGKGGYLLRMTIPHRVLRKTILVGQARWDFRIEYAALVPMRARGENKDSYSQMNATFSITAIVSVKVDRFGLDRCQQ